MIASEKFSYLTRGKGLLFRRKEQIDVFRLTTQRLMRGKVKVRHMCARDSGNIADSWFFRYYLHIRVTVCPAALKLCNAVRQNSVSFTCPTGAFPASLCTSLGLYDRSAMLYGKDARDGIPFTCFTALGIAMRDRR